VPSDAERFLPCFGLLVFFRRGLNTILEGESNTDSESCAGADPLALCTSQKSSNTLVSAISVMSSLQRPISPPLSLQLCPPTWPYPSRPQHVSRLSPISQSSMAPIHQRQSSLHSCSPRTQAHLQTRSTPHGPHVRNRSNPP